MIYKVDNLQFKCFSISYGSETWTPDVGLIWSPVNSNRLDENSQNSS